MVDKPSTFPTWAELDVVDPTSGQNNVTTPPLEKQNYGWAFGEEPPRNWFNWLGRYTNNWLKWFDQQESQSTVTPGDGADASFNASVGGLAYIYVVDKGNAANVYHGMVYLPPANVGATFIDIKKVGITTPTISTTGTVTIAGGTGPYIVYGQTKNIP
jgi:hypothetical protein